jgi:N-acetylglucosamine-6-phosphate deacetylase
MNGDHFLLKNIGIYEDGSEYLHQGLVIDKAKINKVGRMSELSNASTSQVFNGEGWFAAPGLVDLQLNGGYGVYFTNEPERTTEVAFRLPETGVTAFLPTFISSPLSTYKEKLETIASVQQQHEGARILGVHVEGPFLSSQKSGAHELSLLKNPTKENLARLERIDLVKMVTLAPELPDGLAAVEWFVQQGVLVSIGHSACDLDTLKRAQEAGLTCATHLFNAMPSLHHREPGMIASMLNDDQLKLGLIVDGIHVHPEMVKLVWKCRGSQGIMLVTDAMGALGMPPGEYQIGEQAVVVDRTSARLSNGRLAGSILRMDEAVRNMVVYSGCSPAEAVRMASTTPMEALGMDDQFGHLKAGYMADIVIFDQALQVQMVLVNGTVVYSTPAANRRLTDQ